MTAGCEIDAAGGIRSVEYTIDMYAFAACAGRISFCENAIFGRGTAYRNRIFSDDGSFFL